MCSCLRIFISGWTDWIGSEVNLSRLSERNCFFAELYLTDRDYDLRLSMTTLRHKGSGATLLPSTLRIVRLAGCVIVARLVLWPWVVGVSS